jgi:hypothetical protein
MAMVSAPSNESISAYWTGAPGIPANQEPAYKAMADPYQPHANVGVDYLGTVRDAAGARYSFWYDQVLHKITCILMDGQSGPTFANVAYKIWNHPNQNRYGLSHLGQQSIDPKFPGSANVAAAPQPSGSVADPTKANPVSNPGSMDIWWDPVNKILNVDTTFAQSST